MNASTLNANLMPQANLSVPVKADFFSSRSLTWAVVLSILFHFTILQLVPLLEEYNPKPVKTIEAEMVVLPPTQPQAPVPQPMLPQPEMVKPNQDTPKTNITKTQVAEPLPVLKSESAKASADYTVAEANPNAKPNLIAANEVQESEASAPAVAAPSKAEVTSNAPPQDVWDDGVYEEYGRNLQKLCERNKKYPAIAVRRSWQGQGSVVVQFSTGGKVISIAIQQSTGQAVLDEQALEMVRKSLGDLPPPSKLKGREFKMVIPVDFRLE